MNKKQEHNHKGNQNHAHDKSEHHHSHDHNQHDDSHDHGYHDHTAIPLAAGVLFSAGILINPALGAVLMSISTIVVAINAQLLKRKLKINQ